MLGFTALAEVALAATSQPSGTVVIDPYSLLPYRPIKPGRKDPLGSR